METPPRQFHDTVVLSSRLDDDLLPSSKTVSSGTSPIKRHLANLEETSLENQRKQVLDDLMMLAGEGVDLSCDAASGPGERTRRSGSPEKKKNQSKSSSSSSSSSANCVGTNYTTKDLVGSCMYTDMDVAPTNDGIDPPHAPPPAAASKEHEKSKKNKSTEFGGVIYYVDERSGTLGALDLGGRVRRTLLHGLSRPTHVQVVGGRVYWLESGDDWSFSGRLCFL
jgi:hypothetical protein